MFKLTFVYFWVPKKRLNLPRKTQVQKAKIPALDDSTALVEPTLPDPDPVIDADPESPDPVPQHGLLLETAVPRFSTEEKTKSGEMLLGGALPKR